MDNEMRFVLGAEKSVIQEADTLLKRGVESEDQPSLGMALQVGEKGRFERGRFETERVRSCRERKTDVARERSLEREVERERTVGQREVVRERGCGGAG